MFFIKSSFSDPTIQKSSTVVRYLICPIKFEFHTHTQYIFLSNDFLLFFYFTFYMRNELFLIIYRDRTYTIFFYRDQYTTE